MAKKEKKEDKKKEENIGTGFGIVSFVLGIESIILALFIPLISIITSINGIVFGVMQQKKKPTKKGKIGLILNIVGLVLSIISWIIAIIILNNFENILPTI